MKPVPLLFMSDNPALSTGLGRITKDLAVHASSLPEFRVGSLGRGGHSSTQLPFAQYSFSEDEQWGENLIESAWSDFAGSDPGIIMTVWDPSRLNWFANPMMGDRLEQFLKSGRFIRWGYIPVDSYGIGNKLTTQVKDTLLGYDRLLAYTLFGKQIIENTIGREVDWIPHGYDHEVFQPRGRAAGRAILGVNETDTLIGCVMSNQGRKDWATAFGAIAQLRNSNPALKFWAHTDVIERYWNLMALAFDFGIQNSIVVTQTGMFNSEQLSYLYSACDITMLPSLGEGFGYPIVESLACGVPVVHGNYGGGAELLPDRNWLVEPVTERLDGLWNCVRPVWNPKDWAEKIQEVLGEFVDSTTCMGAVEHLQWRTLWPSCWHKFFLEGINR